jgi:arylsulfatase A-like enzyme
MTPPNILFIWTDQHRYDAFGAAGNVNIKTPNIDRLADSGIRFTNAHCPSPICGPGRAACFTGMYPPGCGAVLNWISLKSGTLLMTDHLYQSGYYNALVGKLHLSPAADRHGFDWKRLCDSPHGVYSWDEIIYNDYLRFLERECYPEHPEQAERAGGESERVNAQDPRFWLGWSWADDAHHMTTWTGNESVAFLENWQGKQPFFLNVSFFGPHHPYATSEPWDSMYDPQALPLPDTWRREKTGPVFDRTKKKMQTTMRQWDETLWRDIQAKYYGNISQIDREVGRILDTLKARGLWENTLIVFTADHGDHMGDFGLLGKGDMYDSSVKIPFIVKPPGDDRRAETRNQVVNSIDLFGTFLDAAGNSHWREDEQVEAKSMLPLLDGPAAPWKNETC